ncbi:MAG: N-6 DNA methylase [Proteobacteria bacterium]|nr:N-6 DNA methylase [Pseudomonadota bacterium]MBU2226155.1 N-6 DNA methylase [Pseudomonadota bacterium]
MLDSKDISRVVKELRNQLNLSQEELAAKLGVSFATVNRWENEKITPRGKAREAILKLIEASDLDQKALENAGDIGGNHKKRRRKLSKEDVLSTKSMEQMLWSAACSIRGEKDAPKFKDYILPLVFIKRLSDVFEDEIERLAETYGDEETALTIIEADHQLVRFYIPAEARWPVVSGREKFKWPEDRKPKTLGEQLTMTVRTIAKANPSLTGVIDIVDYNETRSGEREISDTALSGVIETLSDPRYRLGLYDVEPDFLGRAYEYLLRKFAESQGQSAGEFFTPTEVGWLMAYILRPRQGEEVYDFACGSAGLLIKCELALQEREIKIQRPLKLYGQELTGSSYAIARMNMVVHDMEGEIVRGNSMTNPKFKDSDSSLKKFDIVVANPMWNQPFDQSVYENDPFDRFESQGGVTTGKADWAWLQHAAASLSNHGRAAIVLDTGAVTRGSGSKSEDREKKIRQWFVERDWIEGVILLPDNLFYNTTAAGIIIFFNKAKSLARQGRIVLVNAGREFKKGKPKNYIPDENIRKIANAFIKGEDVEKFVKVITTAETAENDFNLSPSRYVDFNEQETYRPIQDILEELDTMKQVTTSVDADLQEIFIGLNSQLEIMKQEIPNNWVETLFRDVGTFYGGGTPSTMNPAFWNGPIQWTTSKRLGESLYLESGERTISDNALKESSTTLIPKGNLLVGTRVGTGKIVVNRIDIAISQDLTGVIVDKSKYLPEFIAYQMRAQRIQEFFHKQKRGVTIQGISRDDLKDFVLYIPPLHEQKKIAAILSKIQRAIEIHASIIERTRELNKTMLNKLMTGEIRVKDLDIDVSEVST